MRAVLAAWRPHHVNDVGIERVYRDVMRRWRRWIVQAKSGTSLERAMRRRRYITLVWQSVDGLGMWEWWRRNVPCDAIEYPDQGEGPAEGGVGADGAPA